MYRFKKSFKVLLIIFLLITLIATYGWSSWQELKHKLGLEVNWQGLSITTQGLNFKHIFITQTKSNSLTQLMGQNINLSFSTLSIKQLTIKSETGTYVTSTDTNTESPPINVKQLLNNLSWAPHHIQVDKLNINLPCATGQCDINGALTIIQNPQADKRLSLHAQLFHEDQQVNILADLYQKAQQLDLQLTGKLNNQPLLTLSSQINANTLNQWQGQLNIIKLNNVQGFFKWLQQWLPLENPVTEVPEALELKAQWQLRFEHNITDLKPTQGYFNLDAILPNPWPIPKLGYLQGNIKTAITINNNIRIEKLDTALTLSHIAKNLLDKLPVPLQPDTVNLQLKPLPINDPTKADRALSIELNTTASGKLTSSFKANAFINTPKTEIELMDGLLQVNGNAKSQEYHLKNIQLTLPFTAIINPKQSHINLQKATNLNLQQLTIKDMVAKNLQLSTNNLTIELNHEKQQPLQFNIKGPITASTSYLKQNFLKPISWKLIGQLETNLTQTNFTGTLSNGAELSTNITLKTDNSKQLTIVTKTPDIFFRSNNPFAQTFKDWPESLAIGNGKLAINGTTTIYFDNTPLSANVTVNTNGLSGIFDRSEFLGLTGSANLDIKNNKLNASIPNINIKELNPGITIGPLQISGRYNTSINTLMKGTLDWDKAELTLFSGKIWLNKGQLNLHNLPAQFNLQIEGLQVKDIFKAYPAEGLDGKGILDGQLPIVITDKGVVIKNGTLSAREQGFLQFNSPQIQALGKNNPNMQIVTDALEDFNYTKLNSTVNYNQGKASLGLTIHGRNPTIEKGQPINLNINLEEDIPALLTSLQLSDKVSEPIRKRVQEHLQQSKTNE